VPKNLYRHTDSRPTAAVLLDVLRQKCAYKAIPVPTLQTLVPHRPALEAMWSDMLSHQLPVLPPLNDFWDALPEIDIAVIALWLGHESIETTNAYLHANLAMKERAWQKSCRWARRSGASKRTILC